MNNNQSCSVVNSYEAKIFKLPEYETPRAGFLCPICENYHWHSTASGKRSPCGHCRSMQNDEEYFLNVTGEAREQDLEKYNSWKFNKEKQNISEWFYPYKTENPEGNEGRVEALEHGKKLLKEFCDKNKIDYEATLQECVDMNKPNDMVEKIPPSEKDDISPDEIIDKLKWEAREQFLENAVAEKINWIVGNKWNWDFIKGFSKKLWDHKIEYIEDKKWKKFFLAHSNDTIKGKPQLIDNVQKTIPLVRKAVRKMEKKDFEEADGIITRTLKKSPDIQSFYFFDEKFDKRHDGFQIDVLSLDFWQYRIIDGSKEYYVWTQQQLPNEVCILKGMLVELDDFAELSRNLKVKSLSKVFFMKEFEPAVKILTNEQIVNYTQSREITEEDWFSFLSYHPVGTYNYFTKELMLHKSAWLLGSKLNGIPPHIAVMGGAGLRKSMGLIETTAYKFDEDCKILEGGNSRIKALSPSFKEKPASIGYLAEANRVAFIDEIGKMVEFEMNKHQTTQGNVMGEINFLLDNKKRFVGSGNDNSCEVQATAKAMFVTNPISSKSTIYQHVGVIDPTTMSRILWIVMDKEEQEFVLSEKGVVRVPPSPTQAHPCTNDKGILDNKIKKSIVLKKCWGKVDSREEFLTLFDTCYSFLSEIDETEVQKLVDETCQLAREPMKTSVWKPRAFHHITLLIDGLCKHRCLFKDYDNSFVAKQEDYELAKKMLTRLINSWDTDLSPKEDYIR